MLAVRETLALRGVLRAVAEHGGDVSEGGKEGGKEGGREGGREGELVTPTIYLNVSSDLKNTKRVMQMT